VNRDLVVVGAGIVGASVAYHAARAGAVVTLVDAGRLGGGVTADSFAWIGASGVRTGPAAGLRATATEEYHRLEAELSGLPVTWSGSLSWGAGGRRAGGRAGAGDRGRGHRGEARAHLAAAPGVGRMGTR
jgi:glycine/D-amino acid oxidase-like deaminating enzyme